VHTETVPAGRASSHEVQGPPCAKDPAPAHRNHPGDNQPGESSCGSNATRNATTAVRTEPEGDHYISVCAGGEAEAEGFEPPVPLGTLAFKVVDPAISGDHPYGIGRSSTRARSLLGLTNHERMQPQMPPLVRVAGRI
jgi:hypothetical protein